MLVAILIALLVAVVATVYYTVCKYDHIHMCNRQAVSMYELRNAMNAVQKNPSTLLFSLSIVLFLSLALQHLSASSSL